MMSVLPVLLFIVSVNGTGGVSSGIARTINESAEAACQLASIGEAKDERLAADVYTPLAGKMLGQMKTIFARPEAKGVTQEMSSYTAPRHEHAPSQSLNTMLSDGQQPDERMVASAAGGVADVIAERYRREMKERYGEWPSLVTYRSPDQNGIGNLGRISDDVRNYCLKLKGLGVSDLFPDTAAGSSAAEPGQ